MCFVLMPRPSLLGMPRVYPLAAPERFFLTSREYVPLHATQSALYTIQPASRLHTYPLTPLHTPTGPGQNSGGDCAAACPQRRPRPARAACTVPPCIRW